MYIDYAYFILLLVIYKFNPIMGENYDLYDSLFIDFENFVMTSTLQSLLYTVKIQTLMLNN
jgi:hypothetical protein